MKFIVVKDTNKLIDKPIILFNQRYWNEDMEQIAESQGKEILGVVVANRRTDHRITKKELSKLEIKEYIEY